MTSTTTALPGPGPLSEPAPEAAEPGQLPEPAPEAAKPGQLPEPAPEAAKPGQLPEPAPPAGGAAPPLGRARVNLYASELSFEDAELIYADQARAQAQAQVRARAQAQAQAQSRAMDTALDQLGSLWLGDRAQGSTYYGASARAPAPSADGWPGVGLRYPPLVESSVDQLLRDLSDTESRDDWPQPWGDTDHEMAAEEGPEYGLGDEAGAADEQLLLVRGLEVTLATVDDTTVETRSKVDGIALDTSIIAAQISRLEGSVGGLAAEVVQLRKDMSCLRAIVEEVGRLEREARAADAVHVRSLAALNLAAAALDRATAALGLATGAAAGP